MVVLSFSCPRGMPPRLLQLPTQFCVNVGIAAAIIMYDRKITMSRFADRPVGTGGPTEVLEEHKFGEPIIRNNR